ncbi:MAG TPA: protein phosphatase 2C domain-containing protein [Anaerolineales bacterium]|nr:protein phosphatase 2C domain-containing protein [Anaerolineales bacterium]
MDNSTKVMVCGKDHESKGEIYSQALSSSDVALGTSVGITSKPNEDCIGASVLDSEMVLAIADGHWGRDASEIAISKAVDLIRPDNLPSTVREIRTGFFALFEQVNTALYEMAVSAPGAPASETTLIVCQIKEASAGKYLYWSSFGDSYLFLLRNMEMKQLNSLKSFWLGYLSKLSENGNTGSILMRFLSDEARYVGVAGGLETGLEKLEPGDMVFLCTDGLIGSDYAPEQSILDEIRDILVSDLSIQMKVEKVIASALGRGERDNISCVATQIF